MCPRSPKGYATWQCRTFVKHSDRLRKMLGESPTGWQAEYRERNNVRACTIGCRAGKGAGREEGKQYQPVPELGNNKKLRPYFPDGTKCHEDNDGKEYFCRDQGQDSDKINLA